jgi:hypothetical protein
MPDNHFYILEKLLQVQNARSKLGFGVIDKENDLK